MWSLCTVQVYHFLFFKRNLHIWSWCKGFEHSRMREVVILIQCHKINFKTTAFDKKLLIRRDETQPDSVLKLNTRCLFWYVDEGSRFANSCLIRLMTLQVISPSEQCTLHSFKVNYNYVTVFYVNLTYVSMWMTVFLCK